MAATARPAQTSSAGVTAAAGADAASGLSFAAAHDAARAGARPRTGTRTSRREWRWEARARRTTHDAPQTGVGDNIGLKEEAEKTGRRESRTQVVATLQQPLTVSACTRTRRARQPRREAGPPVVRREVLNYQRVRRASRYGWAVPARAQPPQQKQSRRRRTGPARRVRLLPSHWMLTLLSANGPADAAPVLQACPPPPSPWRCSGWHWTRC